MKTVLDVRVQKDLSELIGRLANEERLLSSQQIKMYSGTFRARFGPEQLRKLDDDALLDQMHQRTKDSLMYWLEFKNDDEFPSPKFGSIAGGSALKFSIFYRATANCWMGRSERSANAPVEISTEAAIAIARRQREQLIAGTELLQSLAPDASEADYERLQNQMSLYAPDVSDSAWAHKYFSLMVPTKLDDFHTSELQRFHLIKLLQVPPDDLGRYVLAGRFIEIAREMGVAITDLTTALNERNGRKHSYWRLGTSEGDSGPNFWQAMQAGGYAAVGWKKLGDLSRFVGSKTARDDLKRALEEHYPETIPSVIGRSASQIDSFLNVVAEGDLILAANGSTILGIGRVGGDSEYCYRETDAFPNRRAVRWLDLRSWTMPQSKEGLQSTIRQLKNYENLAAIERQLLDATKGAPIAPWEANREKVHKLAGIGGRIQTVLDRKGQVILYGPPGTGKTYWANQTIRDLAAVQEFGALFKDLDRNQRDNIESHRIRTCTFHPAYGYEDFLEGFRPITNASGQLVFEIRDGIFKKLCREATDTPDYHYYLLIDEINRGDIPRVFGELLTILEKSKRGLRLQLAVSGEPFHVPPNVFLVGTMNTADRSIALLDKALRRRFGFIECMPDAAALRGASVAEVPLGPWLDCLNRAIREHVGRDARNLQIGHSYFMDRDLPLRDLAQLAEVLDHEIIPLLEEYCYEDYGTLAKILGNGFVDEAGQKIRRELFEENRRDDLVQALFTAFPEVGKSREAILNETRTPDEES